MFRPQALSRREVLQTASLLGVSGAAMSSAISSARAADGAAENAFFAKDSGLVTGKPKPLKMRRFPDCSPRSR